MEPQTIPYQETPKKQNKTAIIIGIIILLVGIFVTYQITSKSKISNQTEEKKVTITETAPTPTEKPEIKKDTVTIQVLNGTGTPGQAGLVVKTLEKAGYNKDNIKTGNAEEYNNTVTTISSQEKYDEIVDDIKEALSDIFDEIKVKSAKLDSDNEFNIVIVTGGELEPTEKPATVTPTEEITITPTITPSTTPTPTP